MKMIGANYRDSFAEPREQYKRTVLVAHREASQAQWLALAEEAYERMPRHVRKHYNGRDLSGITSLVIHHTVTPDDFPTHRIAQYHIDEKDWPGIGYHYVINHRGKIEQVNRDETVSYHALSANVYALGIALKGNFTDKHPTDIQLAAANWLVNHLRSLYAIEKVAGHKEVPGSATACPGKSWPEWRRAVTAHS